MIRKELQKTVETTSSYTPTEDEGTVNDDDDVL